jgi:hypothetical protein
MNTNNTIEKGWQLGQKYAVIHTKNITRQVGLIQYSANAVAYKMIQSTTRDIETCKMAFFCSFHSLYHIYIS